MIGQSHGAHAAPFDGLDEVLDGRKAIQERELAVHVQVYEVPAGRRRQWLGLAGRWLLCRLVGFGIDIGIVVPPGAQIVGWIGGGHVTQW